MSKSSNAHMGAAKHVPRYLAGTINFDITYKRGGITPTAFSDANWGSDPYNVNAIVHLIMSNGPVSLKEGLQGITAQLTMEAELFAAALLIAIREAVYRANMMEQLGSERR